ncbi:MFS transporter [Vibrio sp. HN007]|uniref:MFS transporter n=1 Tax=Vibrio iocasae TaxID=3098914 RepID=UPI0035D3EEB9
MIELGTREYRSVSLTMAFGSFVIFCNLYLFQPILPTLSKELDISATQVNWIFAATTFTLSMFLVPWALVSESIGRKQVMLLGLFVPPFINFLMLLYPSFNAMVVARAAMGVSLAAFASVAVAYMAEEMTPQALAQSVGSYIAANSLGGITGRVVGGVLADWFDWQTAVLVIGIFSLVGAFIVLRNLPSQKYFKPQKGLFFVHNRGLVQHVRDKQVWFAMIIGGLNFALFVNLFSVIGFRLSEPPYSLPSSLTSLVFLCYLSGTISSGFSGKWTLKFNPISGIAFGSLVLMAGMYIAWFESIAMMIIGLLLISTGGFFTHALAYSWVSQKAKSAKATATALYLVHYYIGGSFGGFLLIYCWQKGAWPLVLLGGTILSLGILWLSYRLRSKSTN